MRDADNGGSDDDDDSPLLPPWMVDESAVPQLVQAYDDRIAVCTVRTPLHTFRY